MIRLQFFFFKMIKLADFKAATRLQIELNLLFLY